MIRTEFYLSNERWRVQYFNRNRNINEYFEQKRGLRTLVADFKGQITLCKWEKRKELIERPIDYKLPVYAYTSHCDPNLTVLFDSSLKTDDKGSSLFTRKKKKETTLRNKLTPDQFECNLENLFAYLCTKQGLDKSSAVANQYASIDYGFDDGLESDNENTLFYAEVHDPQREYNREKHISFLLAPGLSIGQRTDSRLITVQVNHVISFRRHIQYFPVEFPFVGIEFNYIPCRNLYLEVDMTKPMILPPHSSAFKNKHRSKEGQHLLRCLLTYNNYQLCLVEQLLAFTNHCQIIESMTRPVSSDCALEYLTKQSLVPLNTWSSLAHLSRIFEEKPSGCFPWDSFSRLVLRKLNARTCAPSPPLDGEWVSLERLEVCYRLQNTLDFLTDLVTLTDNNAGEMRIEFEKQISDTRTFSARLDTFMSKHLDSVLGRLLPFISVRQVQVHQESILASKDRKKYSSLGLTLAMFAATLLRELTMNNEHKRVRLAHLWLLIDQHRKISSIRFVCALKCLELANDRAELVFFMTPNYNNNRNQNQKSEIIVPAHELTAFPFDTKTRKFLNQSPLKLKSVNAVGENRLVVHRRTDNVECYIRIPSRDEAMSSHESKERGLKLSVKQLPLDMSVHTSESRLTRKTNIVSAKIEPLSEDKSYTRLHFSHTIDVLVTTARKIDSQKRETTEHISLFDPLAGIRSVGNINKLIEELRSISAESPKPLLAQAGPALTWQTAVRKQPKPPKAPLPPPKPRGRQQNPWHHKTASQIYDYSEQFYASKNKIVTEKRKLEMRELARMREEYFEDKEKNDEVEYSNTNTEPQNEDTKPTNWVVKRVESDSSSSTSSASTTWQTMDKLHAEIVNSFSFIHKMFLMEKTYITESSATDSERKFLGLVNEFEHYYERLSRTHVSSVCDEQTRCEVMDETNECTHYLLDKIMLISDNLLFSGRYSTYSKLNLLVSSLCQSLERHTPPM